MSVVTHILVIAMLCLVKGGESRFGPTPAEAPHCRIPHSSKSTNNTSPDPDASPLALMGNIDFGLGVSQSLPLIVSKEVIYNTTDILDKICDQYHPMEQLLSIEPEFLIGGGIDSLEKEFPHMVALGFGEINDITWSCGGSLITEKYVLTAAHCLSHPEMGEVRYAKMGETSLDKNSKNTQSFNIVKRIPHEKYMQKILYNDIALIELDGLADITDYVRPICLSSSTNYEDENFIATGWGKTEQGDRSQQLKKVDLELITQSECQNAYKYKSKEQLTLGIQEPTQLCAGSRTERKDTCRGDSGGPLQIHKNNRYQLIGITSFGAQECCQGTYTLGVYTRVEYYREWIMQIILKQSH